MLRHSQAQNTPTIGKTFAAIYRLAPRDPFEAEKTGGRQELQVVDTGAGACYMFGFETAFPNRARGRLPLGYAPQQAGEFREHADENRNGRWMGLELGRFGVVGRKLRPDGHGWKLDRRQSYCRLGVGLRRPNQI